ncbi:MAG: DUF2147 domain-containing protein [Betaproteobacteria bacterium]|jgi:uncharacterized protein (DUF2147 family)
MKKLTVAAFLLALGANAMAQMTPIGLWNTIDDKTGKPKAEVRISANAAGDLSGVVVRGLEAVADPEPNCEKCSDDRKGKPKIGLEIIRGGKKTEGKDVWEGGYILDPNNGTNYRLLLTPTEAGKKLQVRGYVGTPMLGRTQTWVRVE